LGRKLKTNKFLDNACQAVINARRRDKTRVCEASGKMLDKVRGLLSGVITN
jgi:hypothetical protein